MQKSTIMEPMNLMKIIFLLIVCYLEISATGELDAELTSRGDVANWAGYGEDRLSTVVVSGRLLCHATKGHQKLHKKPNPVPGASVAVFCGAAGRRKKSWAKGSTGNYGEFQIDLPSDLHAIPNLEKVNCCSSRGAVVTLRPFHSAPSDH